MRGLASSTCWLFIIAIVAVFPLSAALSCMDLDENGDLLEQMKACTGEIFRLKPPSKGSFDLSKLDQATADKILYEQLSGGGPNLNKPKKIVGHVTINDSELENLILATSADIGATQEITIVGNMKLNNLKLDVPHTVKLSLTLKGNKELSMQSINTINDRNNIDASTSKIQEFQECSFNGKALGSLADLQGCKRIYEDLIIDQSTKIPNRAPTLRIKKIENGCVKIENSALKDSHFLDDLFKDQMKCTAGKHVIKNNKDLCLSSEQREKWIAAGFELVYTGTCDDRCTVDYAMKNKDATKAACDIVVGDVKITGDHRRRRQSGTPPKLAHWDRVKELEGTLEISNTNMENIVIFNNLERITNPSPDKIALAAIKNPKMVKFDLPKLKNITMPSNTWSEPVIFYENGNFSFPHTENARWKSISGRSYPSIPFDSAPLTTAAPTTPGTTTMSVKKKIEEHNAGVKTSQGWIITGVAVGGFLLVLLIGLIIVAVVFRVSCTAKLPIEDFDLASSTHLLTVVKKKETTNKEEKKDGDKKEEISEEVTLAAGVDTGQHKLEERESKLVAKERDAVKPRQKATKAQMALEAEEIPFKMTDIIRSSSAPELDLERARKLLTEAPLPKMKYKGKPYRFIDDYKLVFFNAIEPEEAKYMKEYDRIAVFKQLITRCSNFFVTNPHLMPHIIADCSGPYYTPNGSLLAEIEGPVYVIGDLHEAMDVLHTVLNLDLDGEGKKHKIHPMFRHRYLFLGDYLDKGDGGELSRLTREWKGTFGLEVYFLLCIASRLFPELFTVVRGNHDSRVSKDEYTTIESYGDALRGRKALDDYMENDRQEDEKREEDRRKEGITDEERKEQERNKIKREKESKNRIKGLEFDHPHEFANLMLIDLVTKITPFLPMAAIINGHTFAAHGAFTMSMVTSKKSIREIFKEIPVPYYDEPYYKKDLAQRPFPEGTGANWILKKHEEMRKATEKWWNENEEYMKKKEKNPNTPPDPNFESRFPGLYTVMWSDPNPTFASAGNHRGAGCTFNAELVQKMMENNKSVENGKSIVDIIRAHEVVGFAQSCDNRVTTVFTNCQSVQKDSVMFPECFLKSASILRINEDGTRTVIFLSMTADEKKQALFNPKRKIKRQIEEDEELKKDKKHVEKHGCYLPTDFDSEE